MQRRVHAETFLQAQTTAVELGFTSAFSSAAALIESSGSIDFARPMFKNTGWSSGADGRNLVSVASDEVALLYPADADHFAFDWCAACRFAAGRICMRGRCDPIVTGMTDHRRAIERSDKPAGSPQCRRSLNPRNAWKPVYASR